MSKQSKTSNTKIILIVCACLAGAVAFVILAVFVCFYLLLRSGSLRASIDHRWLNVDEAKQKLLACQIHTVDYGENSIYDTDPPSPGTINGDHTGIEYYWTNHSLDEASYLRIEQGQQAAMLPLIHEAQSKCEGGLNIVRQPGM